ncbi:MAG: hypothetical protein RBJ76_04880 [Stenomitos frigidus ULC029]
MTTRHRPVNQALGLQPRFGPLPADQVFPWLGIAFAFYFLFNQLLRFNWLWTGLLIVWGCSTWWLLTGSRAYLFMGKFIPLPNWTRGRVGYLSPLAFVTARDSQSAARRQVRHEKTQTRLQTAKVKRSTKR